MTFHPRSEWWRGAVLYQIYTRSFLDTDGDGIGDLRGITRRLDYIAELGVDGIWLTPFFPSPMRDFGYDVSEYCDVDPTYGTLADFDRLIARAHTLGLKVLIDQVWCHTSDEHAWFQQSRSAQPADKADWYVWADPQADGTPPNNWLSVFGGSAWTWAPGRRQYYLHHFLPSQPKLNLHNEAVVDQLLSVADFWLERGVDGFRLDAVDFMLHDPLLRSNPPRPAPGGVIPVKPFGLQHHLHDMLQDGISDRLMARIRCLLDRHPGTAALGEVSSQDGAIERCHSYTRTLGDRLHMAYTLGVVKSAFSVELFRALIAQMEDDDDQGWLCWSFSNHDVPRAISRWHAGARSESFSRLLMALLLTLKGSVSVYQGEELGLPEATLEYADVQDPFGRSFWPTFVGRDGARTPMPWQAGAPNCGFSAAARPWLPIPADHRRLAADVQTRTSGSLLQDWQGFLRWRRRHPALRQGTIHAIELPEPLLGYVRQNAEERLLLLFNLADAPVSLALAALPAFSSVQDFRFPATVDAEEITLPGHGFFAAHCA